MYEQEREEGTVGQGQNQDKWEDEEQGVLAVVDDKDGQDDTAMEDAAAQDGERYSAEQRPPTGQAPEPVEQVPENRGGHQQSLQGVPDQEDDEQPNELAIAQAEADQTRPDRVVLTPPRQARKTSAASHPPEADNVSQTPSGSNTKLPPWMKSESKPYLSKDERRLYKLFTFLPVVVTFIIYTMLLVYYIGFYLYPSIIGDFYQTWQIPYMWTSVAEKEQSALTAKILSGVFAFTSLSLLINLVLTIATDPGQIPEEVAWDMPEEKEDSESKASSAMPKQQKLQFGNEVDFNPNAPALEPRGSASSDLSHQIAFQNRFATGVLRAPLARSPGHLPEGEELEGGSQEINADNDQPAASEPQNMYYNKASSPRYEIEQDQELQKPLVQREEVDTVQGAPAASARPGGAQGGFSIERKQYGGVRICQRCLRMKPDRTHHCSQCHRCVLKMDHHCDWVGNCIGFSNYKYFLNTLFYASASTIIIATSSSRVASHALKISEVPAGSAVFIVIAYVLACVLAIIITCFFLFHLWLTTNQYTTIEYREKRTSDLFKNRSPYDLGAYRNLQAVLGENPLVWLLPFARNLEGGGLQFRVRPDLRATAATTKDDDKSQPSETKRK